MLSRNVVNRMGRRIPDATSSMLCSALKFLTVRATYIDSYESQSEDATRRNPMVGFLKHAKIGSVREHGMKLCAQDKSLDCEKNLHAISFNITRRMYTTDQFFSKEKEIFFEREGKTVATWNIDC
jgi:hypothetical protein